MAELAPLQVWRVESLISSIPKMQRQTNGIIISVKQYAEDSFLIKCLTEDFGMLSGMIQLSARNKKRFSTLAEISVGNYIQIIHYAREGSLGKIVHEIKKPYANLLLNSRLGLLLIVATCNATDVLFYKNEMCVITSEVLPNILNFFDLMLKEDVEVKKVCATFVLVIANILRASGHGLDLTKCVATGATNNLTYISPKSLCAVSEEAAKPYKKLMLKLPPFVLEGYNNPIMEMAICPSAEEITDGLLLVGKFFNKFGSEYAPWYFKNTNTQWNAAIDIATQTINK